MSKTEIYYFSGTGNSLAVARDVARRLEAKVSSIAPLMGEESIHSEADAIGFVFPIYDFKPPRLLDSFASKIADINSKYLFAICTYGIAPSRSLQHLDQTIRACGGTLSAGFAVAMPHNGIGSGVIAQAEHVRMFANWKARLPEVCEYIDARKKGRIESGSVFSNLFRTGFIKMLPSALKFLVLMLSRGADSLGLISSADCTGCGTCQKVCPAKNVEIVEGKPRWSTHCFSCFACLHWCPKQAISVAGVDLNIGHYHHPDVRITDML